ncbi:MAG: two-component sensor histidine kinase [Alphaproteobacteria bacterium CG_4_10_14_0_2_um_filter_63_37]|nr:MAG: hypothetical protein AUJ55_09435 [Proteobacteria bacterium CG1_02_64_396]PJA23690.1 MAG: two-component sensor histidine kinase [Alphaproteobacteria bacterium CG_4_10_14_0_2_um_filter_63_37]
MIPRILKTNAFRLAILYAAFFGASVLALLSYLYWDTVRHMDHTVANDISTEMGFLQHRAELFGIDDLADEIARRSAPSGTTDHLYLLSAPDGHIVAGNLPGWPDIETLEDGMVHFSLRQEWEHEDEQRRREPHPVQGVVASLLGGGKLLVGRDTHERQEIQENTLRTMAGAMGAMLVVALVVGGTLSRGVLHRLETVNLAIRGIMEGNLKRRLPLDGSGDEVDRLLTSLNAMLERIDRLMEGMRNVTDNVAHDLRTPLSRMRSRMELGLMEVHDANELRSILDETVTDLEGVIATFNALLAIAQAESGAGGPKVTIDLNALVEDVGELYGALAEEEGVDFEVKEDPGLTLQGNRHLLAQALGNLLDNAIKYTPSGGQVRLGAWSRGGKIVLQVSDSGPGIPTIDRERVLDRFTRLDASRTTPGNGLGLSMVRAAALWHGAKLELSDTHPGQPQPGLTVTLVFSGPDKS